MYIQWHCLSCLYESLLSLNDVVCIWRWVKGMAVRCCAGVSYYDLEVQQLNDGALYSRVMAAVEDCAGATDALSTEAGLTSLDCK